MIHRYIIVYTSMLDVAIHRCNVPRITNICQLFNTDRFVTNLWIWYLNLFNPWSLIGINYQLILHIYSWTDKCCMVVPTTDPLRPWHTETRFHNCMRSSKDVVLDISSKDLLVSKYSEKQPFISSFFRLLLRDAEDPLLLRDADESLLRCSANLSKNKQTFYLDIK